MTQIVRCNWLPSGQDGAILPARDYPGAVSRKQNFTKSYIINPLLTKFVPSRWLDIGFVLFLRVYGPRLRLGPWTRKKRTWPISSHLDRTNLVNNPYILAIFFLLVYGPTVYWRFMNTQRLTINKVFIEWHKHNLLARNSWAIGNWVTEGGPDLEQRATGLDCKQSPISTLS